MFSSCFYRGELDSGNLKCFGTELKLLFPKRFCFSFFGTVPLFFETNENAEIRKTLGHALICLLKPQNWRSLVEGGIGE